MGKIEANKDAKRKTLAFNATAVASKKAKTAPSFATAQSGGEQIPERAQGLASTSTLSSQASPVPPKALAKFAALQRKLAEGQSNSKVAVINSKLLMLAMRYPALKGAIGLGQAPGQSQGSGGSGQAAQRTMFKFPHAANPGAFVYKQPKTSSTFLSQGMAAGADDMNRRAERFAVWNGAGDEDEELALADSGGMGTNTSLEKDYLRLTSMPRQSDVRPPAILAAALRMVKAKWSKQPDYTYACEQLKSIRQDLTVQHVRSQLTVDVYETHGRLALEEGDTAQFRQCHAVLRSLYRDGLAGNAEEFEAYGLLFTQATRASRKYLSLELTHVPQQALQHPYVRHALQSCLAFRTNDYALFLSLYRTAPRMSPYLMDMMLASMRHRALAASVAAHKPTPLPLTLLASMLGVESAEEAASFAESAGAAVDRIKGEVDTRSSNVSMRLPLAEAGPVEGDHQ